MALFGAPYGKGDDAIRAVRSAMALKAEWERAMQKRPANERLLLKVGLTTGKVLAGSVGTEARLDYTAIGDSGTIIHPRAYGGQLLGRSVLGMSHALSLKTVYDQHYGLSMTQRFYQSRPPTLLDVPRNMQWEALNIPDPETPVGARGIGEPPVAAGACAILNALSDALGDDVYRRAPVTMDTILMALEHGRPMQDGLTAHI